MAPPLFFVKYVSKAPLLDTFLSITPVKSENSSVTQCFNFQVRSRLRETFIFLCTYGWHSGESSNVPACLQFSSILYSVSTYL